MSFFIAIIVGTLYFTYKPLFKYIAISKLSFAKIKELAKSQSVRAEFRDFSVAQMQKLQALADSMFKKKPKGQESAPEANAKESNGREAESKSADSAESTPESSQSTPANESQPTHKSQQGANNEK